jgi:serine/threonine protein kinase
MDLTGGGGAQGVGEPRTKHLMQQLVLGLRCMRRNGVMHRDLKPQNLLLHQLEDRRLLLKVSSAGSLGRVYGL